MNKQNIASGIYLILASSSLWWLFSVVFKSLNSPKNKDSRGVMIFILVMLVFSALLSLLTGVAVLFSDKPFTL